MADDTRIVAILNHTSLYEPLIAGYASTKLLWRFARHGVLPVAEKTMKRPIGLFFRFLVRHTVTVTRQRDSTWEDVLNRIDNRALVIILPEGRMKRRTGLDSKGREMTVRAGIADILEALPGRPDTDGLLGRSPPHPGARGTPAPALQTHPLPLRDDRYRQLQARRGRQVPRCSRFGRLSSAI